MKNYVAVKNVCLIYNEKYTTICFILFIYFLFHNITSAQKDRNLIYKHKFIICDTLCTYI